MSYNPERNYSEEECFHVEHADSRWLRYCPAEAVNIDGELGKVLDQMHIALYETETTDRSSISYVGEADRKVASRSYDYEQDYMQSDMPNALRYRMRTTITHSQISQPSREVHHVVAEWYMASEYDGSGIYRTEYCIEQFEQGDPMATITEFDMVADKAGLPVEDMPANHFADRPMTVYDHQQLYRLMTDITELQLAK